MNPTKCQQLHFSNSRESKTPPFETEYNVIVFGTSIFVVKEAKLFGLTVTGPKLKLILHCRNIRAKAENRINLLRSARGTLWGANVPTLLSLC